MAHKAADGSMWTNAAQARRVPGKAQGDGRQPVSKFSKPEAPRQPTAEPVSGGKQTPDTQEPAMQDDQDPAQTVAEHGPAQEVTVKHDGDQHTVASTHADGHKHHSKHASAEEAHQAASQLAGAGPQQAPEMGGMNPAQAMM